MRVIRDERTLDRMLERAISCASAAELLVSL